MTNKQRVGLALSGGGYRASAFHLGTLKKLNELGALKKIDVLSTISGGSITGAAWCLHEGEYAAFHEKISNALQTKSVIKYILTSWVFFRTVLLAIVLVFGAVILSFTSFSWLVFPLLTIFIFILFKYQFALFPVSNVIERAYNKFFFEKKKLADLKDRPILAIGSSNLHTGRPFTFSKTKMSDSSYAFREEFQGSIKFKHQEFPVARAVVASSCVPFAFTPVLINEEFYESPEDYKKVRPVLVDGGVYDNQGIQKLTQPKSSYECSMIVTSDAGGNFVADKSYSNTLSLLLRTVELFMYRIKAAQMVQNIYRNVEGSAKPIAYFSLGWRIDQIIPGFVRNMCEGQVLDEVITAHEFTKDWIERPKDYVLEITKHLETRVGYASIKEKNLTEEQWQLARTTGTNLTILSAERISYLIRHAENLTELQVKLYCPALI